MIVVREKNVVDYVFLNTNTTWKHVMVLKYSSPLSIKDERSLKIMIPAGFEPAIS